MEESALYQEIVQGSESAFATLFRELYSPLCGYSQKYLPDLENAEEVVQDVFCNFWEKREKLEIKSSLTSYLYTSVRNRCLNEIRRQKNTSLQIDARPEDYGHVDSRIEEIELDQRIDNAISQLPEMSRKVFELSRFEEKKYKEIAEELSISVKAVEANMSRALKKLRQELKDYLISIIVFLFM